MGAESEIVVVSGLPRSGTSLMMQMLERGGVMLVTDQLRTADIDNPRGYYEFEAVKNLAEDASWISTSRGQAIKVVSLLLYHLPPAEEYRVIFMLRDLDEIVSSQEAMLKRLNRTPAPREEIKEAFRVHLENLKEWLDQQSKMSLLYVAYGDLIQQPRVQAERVSEFLDRPLDIDAMVCAVDPSLYRNRL